MFPREAYRLIPETVVYLHVINLYFWENPEIRAKLPFALKPHATLSCRAFKLKSGSSDTIRLSDTAYQLQCTEYNISWSFAPVSVP